MTDLREQFRPRLVATARERMQRACAQLDNPGNAGVIEAELHALAGEAGLIGYAELAEAARTAETMARAAVASQSAAAFSRCARSVRAVARLVEALAAEGTPTAPPRDTAAPTAATGSCIALVIDDSDIAREQLEAALTAAGMCVRSAATIDSAMAALASDRPHIVLADVNMPGMHDGVCGELRAAASGAPVLLVSALDDEELDARAAAVGADGYASKQRGPAAIVACIRATLEARGP